MRQKKENDKFRAKQRQDGGRGAGITGAHFHKNWANDSFRKQVLNAIAWCAKLDVPKGGVMSPKISEDMLNENLDKRKPKFKRLSLNAASPKLNQKLSHLCLKPNLRKKLNPNLRKKLHIKLP